MATPGGLERGFVTGQSEAVGSGQPGGLPDALPGGGGFSGAPSGLPSGGLPGGFTGGSMDSTAPPVVAQSPSMSGGLPGGGQFGAAGVEQSGPDVRSGGLPGGGGFGASTSEPSTPNLPRPSGWEPQASLAPGALAPPGTAVQGVGVGPASQAFGGSPAPVPVAGGGAWDTPMDAAAVAPTPAAPARPPAAVAPIDAEAFSADSMPPAGEQIRSAGTPAANGAGPAPGMFGTPGVGADPFARPPAPAREPVAAPATKPISPVEQAIPRPSRPVRVADASTTASSSSASASASGPTAMSVSHDASVPFDGISEESRMFRVAQMDDRPEDIPIDDSVRNRIDPLVEFNDIFQDIRRAERGDDKRASERYFDTGLFGNELESRVPLPEPAEEVPESEEPAGPGPGSSRTTRLDLRAGALASASTSQAAPRAMDSDLIAAALAESGLSEPSEAALPEREKQPAVADLDLTGESHRGESHLGAARAFGGGLVVLLCIIGTLGFIASKNDWLLDLREFDQMLGVAFAGEEYQPRAVSVVRVVDGVETVVGDSVADVPPGAQSIEVGELSSGVYEATHGGRFLLVDGTIRNDAAAAYRHIAVAVEVTGADGSVRGVRVVPAGARMEQPSMEASVNAADLDAAYADLDARVADFTLGAGAETAFSAVFLLEAGEEAVGMHYEARVVAAERSADACWVPVAFDATAEQPNEGSGEAAE